MALRDEQIDKLRGTLLSLGWQEVMKPVLQNSGKVVMDMVMDPAIKRDGEYLNVSDDFLKGEFRAYRKVLTLFENEVVAYDENRMRDQLRQKMQDQVVGSPYGSDTNGGEPAS